MIITGVPFYCGGRFIAGFHNPNPELVPGHVYRKSCVSWSGPSGNIAMIDPCPYLPSDFVEFLQILRKFLYADHGKDGYQGVVYAVTNPQQTRAPKYLKDAGFVEAGKFSKGMVSNQCITWIGDYREKIWPIISKVPNWSETKDVSKFKKPESQPIPQQDNFGTMQNPFRDIPQQTLSAATVAQGTLRSRS